MLLSSLAPHPFTKTVPTMQFRVPRHDLVVDVPEEWWKATTSSIGISMGPHYCAAGDSIVVPIQDVEPPLRDGGKIWFRNRDSVVQILDGMRSGEELPPIQVWSREKTNSSRYIVRDGLHRFYLSIAVGFTAIPVVIDDFDLNEFLANEAKGLR